MKRLLLLFALLIALSLHAIADEPVDNVCFVAPGSGGAIGWAGLCHTDDDWTAGWYVYQKGCPWTWFHHSHLRGALSNKGDQSCVIAAEEGLSGYSVGDTRVLRNTGPGNTVLTQPAATTEQDNPGSGNSNSGCQSREHFSLTAGDVESLAKELDTTYKYDTGILEVEIHGRNPGDVPKVVRIDRQLNLSRLLCAWRT